jgi:hypothetical protein
VTLANPKNDPSAENWKTEANAGVVQIIVKQNKLIRLNMACTRHLQDQAGLIPAHKIVEIR